MKILKHPSFRVSSFTFLYIYFLFPKVEFPIQAIKRLYPLCLINCIKRFYDIHVH